MDHRYECLDGNEAAARVAYAVSEVIAIYPITPRLADGRALPTTGPRRAAPNLWGSVPGRRRDADPRRALLAPCTAPSREGRSATTFTASQGLLLMIPNMFKIAGELTPAVIHVAARTVATHALSIFGDHSDVMARADDRLGDARGRLGPGGTRLRARGPCGDAPRPDPVPPLLRRLRHLARDQQDRGPRRRRHPLASPRR